jgi:signal peptide peptidase SppA
LPSFEGTDDDDAQPFDIVGNTAIIPIEGVILNKCSSLESLCGCFSLEQFKQSLKAVAVMPGVENIILNISSGGGVITGVPEAADLIAAVGETQDVYAYSNDIIGSAAYWLASQAGAIFISQSAEVGSIGVYSYLIDSSGAFQQAGLKPELFKSGQYKAAGIDGLPLSDAQREMFQQGVDKAFAQFVGYVQAARKKVPAEAMQGQMLDSTDALKAHLIDGVVNDLDALISKLNGQ